MKKSTPRGFSSICIKDHQREAEFSLAHVSPVYATSTFVYESVEKAQQIFGGEAKGLIYSRWNNPNIELVEDKIAQLECYNIEENGKPVKAKGLMFSSGMAAISAILSSLLKRGDTLLTQGNLYGATTEFMQSILQLCGIKVIFENLTDISKIEDVLNTNDTIKAIYIETPNNPTLECVDLSTIGKLAEKYSVLTICDNTFSTPYFQQPFKFGIDFIVHSTTKFLNGHSTALGGIVIGRDTDFMEKQLWNYRKLTGAIPGAFDAWLLNNGLKTLALRMEKHQSNSMTLARNLEAHPKISRVYYPGLPSNESHDIAKRQMSGYGGVLSFELSDGYEAGIRMMNNIRFCTLTSSIGSADTLIQHPASMTHSFVPKAQREKYGITDGLIRLSVGLEDVEDINTDLVTAIS